MHIAEFIEYIQQSPDLSGIFRIVFVSKQHDPLFLSLCMHSTEKFLPTPVVTLDGDKHTAEELLRTLHMMVFGNRSVYWLKEGKSVDAIKQAIASYQGPHLLLVSRPDEKESEGSLVVSIPERVDQALYGRLLTFLYPSYSVTQLFSNKLFKKQATYSLVDAVRMMPYHMCLGTKTDDFFTSWFEKIVVPDTSLFTLSQYFFAGNRKEFYAMWYRVKDDFPPEFWISYWAEQTWQALHYCSVVKEQGVAAVKNHSYRLPFSFMRTDYKRYTPAVLSNHYERLYQLDHALKNGEGSLGFDVWFTSFLS